jgi:CubicO group peptidase (beta-lactamase class C family)
MSSLSVSDGPPLPACHPDDAVHQLEEMVANALKVTPANLKASPGAAVLVIAGGTTIVRQCWGQENVDAGRHITEHTVFDLASLSKQFTALAVVRLVGEGRVALTAPLSAYVSDFAPTPKSKTTSSWSHVTVQHLLHHTSGLHAIKIYELDPCQCFVDG